MTPFRVALLAPLLFACGPEAQLGPPASEDGPTYHRDLRPLVEMHCLSCHVEGGIGPFALDSYEALQRHQAAVVNAVEAGAMPPWLPDPSCRRYRYERVLTEEEKGRFRRWVLHGMEEGDPRDYRPPGRGHLTAEDLGPPSVVLRMPEYLPRAELPDDYRCFVLDHEFPEETYLRTSNVVPLQKELVHHVLLYLVAPRLVPELEALEARDAGPGYNCFGGVGVSRPQRIAGWLPGTPIDPGSDEAAIRIPAGAKVVLQMHYSTAGMQVAQDSTSVDLWFLEQRPPYLLEPRFFPHYDLEIPAGDPHSLQTRDFVNDGGGTFTIVSAEPHMHLLGTRARARKIGAGGEECIIDIPRWDFAWQQQYSFREGEELVVRPGEALRLECWYDNSRGTAPVRWGEASQDEMCLYTFVLMEPYTPFVDSEAP